MDNKNLSPKQVSPVIPESKLKKMVVSILRILTLAAILTAGGYFLLVNIIPKGEASKQISTDKPESEDLGQSLTDKSESKTTKQNLTAKPESETPGRIIAKKPAEKGSVVLGEDCSRALVGAANRGDNEKIKKLIYNGCDINAQNQQGSTALMQAGGFKDNPDMVKLLIKNGADVNMKDYEDMTALMHMLRNVNDESAKILIEMGADVNVKNNTGRTALLYASIRSNTEIVKALLEKGADVNVKSNSGETALIGAASYGKIETLNLLIENGADINAKDNSGVTALMTAVLSNKPEIIKFLIENGADVNAKSNKGDTALSRAVKREQKEKIELLIDAGAKGDYVLPKEQKITQPDQIITDKLYFEVIEQNIFEKPAIEHPGEIITNDNKSTLSSNASLAKRMVQFKGITSATTKVYLQVPAYSLPLDLSKDISNWSEFSDRINLSDSAKSLLSKNGFVTIDNQIFSKEYFAGSYSSGFYAEIQKKDLPVFITTDSLLHYYHVFFDTSLLRMEKDIFYDDAWQMNRRFYDDSLNIYQNSSDPLVKEAARRNVAYLATALELLKPKPDQIVSADNVKDLVNCVESWVGEGGCNKIYERVIQKGTFSTFGQKEAEKYSFTPPDFVNDLVTKELQLIGGQGGWSCSPIFFYQEDYSQYVPRGHYTRSEKLKNYFKALMWYGRITDLLKGSADIKDGQCVIGGKPDGFISANDAKIQTLQASILARKFAMDSDIQKKWNRIYAITAFYVGFSDDLGPVEYSAALKDIFGDNVDVNSLAGKIDDIQKTVDNKFAGPKIYSGLGNVQLRGLKGLKKQIEQLLANTKGFRMMGQRFVVDSYFFSKIVTPYSGEYTGPADKEPFTSVETPRGKVRGFPRGLDIMALFGSERAKQIIKDLGDADYSDYQSRFDDLKKEIDVMSKGSWYKNLYWNWLYVLKTLIVKFESGYPTFMQTTAWQDKELNTALASWSELRHDTMLFVKQSFSGAEMGDGPKPKRVGYVEPVPLFYARLLDLTRMTEKGLINLLSQDEWDKIGVGGAMNHFEKILSRLVDISKTELENRELTDDDYRFIKYFGESLEPISTRLLAREGNVDLSMFRTTLIADVHTDGNTHQVLEEGTGYIKPMIVAYKLPGNYILVGVGPVFSYYEFKQPMSDRLTDEKWRSMLRTKPPAEPEWTKSFSE